MSEKYIVADLRTQKHDDKYISFWCPDAAGYTVNLHEAGVFTFQQTINLNALPCTVFAVVPIASITEELLHIDEHERCVIPNTLTMRKKLSDRKLTY